MPAQLLGTDHKKFPSVLR